MVKMGLQFGLEGDGKYCKRQFRWLFEIPEVVGDVTSAQNGIPSLPPEKSSRPSLDFKEIEVKHFTEDYFYPGKPNWKPVTLTLWDLKLKVHPVFKWLQEMYDPETANWYTVKSGKFIKTCYLTLYDGTGDPIERWVWEDAWPQAINFQNLDMTTTGIVMCEITLRYARAYIEDMSLGQRLPATGGPLSPGIPPNMA